MISVLNLKAQIIHPTDPTQLYHELKKLKNTATVLYLAAHPDDENTRLLSWLANEKGVRTAYLSLTRGSGGQNLIGPEKGLALGVIRTHELLAAREIDGAEQYFSTAYDFGYSKTSTETFNKWDSLRTLGDVVFMVRHLKPDIIITRFPPDKRGGHGHHSASAELGIASLEAAMDTTTFPIREYGFPHKVKRVVWNAYPWRNPDYDTTKLLNVEVGGFNETLGKWNGEIAGEARSMHKCQGFGSPKWRGGRKEYFQHLAGEKAKNSLFDGIITDWSNLEGGKKFHKKLNRFLKNYWKLDAKNRPKEISELLEELKGLNQDQHAVKRSIFLLRKALVQASSVYLAFYTTQNHVCPGDSIKVSLEMINPLSRQISLESISIKGTDLSQVINRTLSDNASYIWKKDFLLSDKAAPSNPFWIAAGLKNNHYQIEDREELLSPGINSVMKAQVNLEIAGQEISLYLPLVKKTVDPVKGEYYSPFQIFPKISVNYGSNLIFGQDQAVEINYSAHTDVADFQPLLVINPSNGSDTAFVMGIGNKPSHELKKNRSISFTAMPGAIITNDSLNVFKSVDINSSHSEFHLKKVSLNYDHIPEMSLFLEDSVSLISTKIRTTVKKIAYLSGAGDQMPQSLENLGITVDLFGESDVNSSLLSPYEVVILGIRAYNVYDNPQKIKSILDDYVKNGGHLIVQYQTSYNFPLEFVGPDGIVPGRSRITEENAEMRFLLPDHRIFNNPNTITSEDFQGWVQERGLYFAEKWPDRYQALLAGHDIGEDDVKGSLIVGSYGKGTFIYTGISFFRQLPAGVAGAYKLFSNLISYEQAQ